MKEKEDALGAIAVAMMLILTAWGNAIALMVGSIIGLVIMMIVFKGRLHHGTGLAVTVAMVIAATIAIAFFLGWKGEG
jgi:hypothetical protein